jgi:hypothetical protein
MTITLQTIDPEGVLLSLTTEEKIQLLSGSDMCHTTAVPRLDIPRVRVSLSGRVELMTDERWPCE